MSKARMGYQKSPQQRFGLMIAIVVTLSVAGCATQQQPKQYACEGAAVEKTASIDQAGLWEDATKTTIGETYGVSYTNRVELADINGDGLVDVLFANGGDYADAGEPDFSKVFLNQGPDQMFEESTRQVLGPTPMLARVIKVRDVNADGSPDILIGTDLSNSEPALSGRRAGRIHQCDEDPSSPGQIQHW